MNNKSKVENIDGNQLIELLGDKASNYQFVDVRTPGEFNSGRIKEFINIPLQVLENSLSELDKEIPVVLICASGSRSVFAARLLKSAGFSSILNVRGGISIFS